MELTFHPFPSTSVRREMCWSLCRFVTGIRNQSVRQATTVFCVESKIKTKATHKPPENSDCRKFESISEINAKRD